MPYSSYGVDVEANALRRDAEWAQKRAAKAARKAALAAEREQNRARKQAEHDQREQAKLQKLMDRAERKAADAAEKADKLRQREEQKTAKEQRAAAARVRKSGARQRAQAARRAQPAQLALPLQPTLEPLAPLEPLQAVRPGVAGFAAPPPMMPGFEQGWCAVSEEQLREEAAAAARRRERANAALVAKNAAGVDAAHHMEQAAMAEHAQSKQKVELARVAREEAEARAKTGALRPLALAPSLYASPDVPLMPLPAAGLVAVGVAVGAPVVPAAPAAPVVLGETPCPLKCLNRATAAWVARLYEPDQMASSHPTTVGDVCVFHEASLHRISRLYPEPWYQSWGGDLAGSAGYWSPLANAAPHVLLQAMWTGLGIDTPLATVGAELTAEPSLRPRIAQDGDPRYTTGANLDRPSAPFVAHRIWWNLQRATQSFQERNIALFHKGAPVPGEFVLRSLHSLNTPMQRNMLKHHRGIVESLFYNPNSRRGVGLYGKKAHLQKCHDVAAPCSQTLYIWHGGTAIGAITFRVFVTCDGAVVFLVELLGTLKSWQKRGVGGHLIQAMREFAPPEHTGPHRVLTCANNFLWWKFAGMNELDEIREPQPDACKLYMNVSLLDPLFMIDDPALQFQTKKGTLVDCGGTPKKPHLRLADGSYQLLFNLPPLE